MYSASTSKMRHAVKFQLFFLAILWIFAVTTIDAASTLATTTSETTISSDTSPVEATTEDLKSKISTGPSDTTVSSTTPSVETTSRDSKSTITTDNLETTSSGTTPVEATRTDAVSTVTTGVLQSTVSLGTIPDKATTEDFKSTGSTAPSETTVSSTTLAAGTTFADIISTLTTTLSETTLSSGTSPVETTTEEAVSTVTTGISETTISLGTSPVETTTEDVKTMSTAPSGATSSSTTMTGEKTSADVVSTVTTGVSETTISSDTATTQDLQPTVSTAPLETAVSSTTWKMETTSEEVKSTVSTAPLESTVSSTTLTMEPTSEEVVSTVTTEVSETTLSSRTSPDEATTEASTAPSETTGLSTTMKIETTLGDLLPTVTSRVSETPISSATSPVETTSEDLISSMSTAPLETTVSSNTLTTETTTLDLTSAVTSGVSESPISSATPSEEVTTEDFKSTQSSAPSETPGSSTTVTVEATSEDVTSAVTSGISETSISSTATPKEEATEDLTSAVTSGTSESPISSATPPVEATTQVADFRSTVSTAPLETTVSSITLTVETTPGDLTSAATSGVSETPILSTSPITEKTTEDLQFTVSTAPVETTVPSATLTMETISEDLTYTATTGVSETRISATTPAVKGTTEDFQSTLSTASSYTTLTMETTSEDLTSEATSAVTETPISPTTSPVEATTLDFQSTVSTAPSETTASSTTLTMETTSEELTPSRTSVFSETPILSDSPPLETTSEDFQSTVSTAPSETTASSTTLTMETTSEELTSSRTSVFSETPISSDSPPLETTSEDFLSTVSTASSYTTLTMETTSEDLTSQATSAVTETPISPATSSVEATTLDFQSTVSTAPSETTALSTTLTMETTSEDFQSTVSTAPSETTASSTTLTMETTSEDLTSTVTTGISETPISSATAPVDTTTEDFQFTVSTTPLETTVSSTTLTVETTLGDLTSAVTTGVSETPASSLTPTVDTTSEVLTTEVETTTSSATLTVETTSEVSTVPSGTTVLSTTLTMETTSEALTSATTSGISETPTLSGTPPVDTTSEASTAPLETTVSSTTLTMETTSADLTSAATTGISETPISSATTPLETTTEESTSMMTSVVFETLTSSATPTVETTTKDSESTVSTSPSKTTASSTSLIVETTSKDVTYATTTGVSKTPISSGTPPAEATTQDFQSTASTAPSETTSSSTTLTMETTSEDLTSTVTNVVSETPIFSAPSTVETTTKALTSTVTSGVPETPTLSATPPVQKTTENFQSTASTAPLETTASSRTLTVETTSEDIKSTASTQRAGTTPSLHTSPVPTTTGTTTEAKPTCAPGEFDCGQLVCISGLFQCDGNRDCEDGSDEDNCVGCRNYCFQEEPRGDCYCDASCKKFGDCCEDYYEYCTLPAYTTKSPGVNECDPEKPLHDCNENAFCTDTPEGFNCTCNEGYEGNGKSCNDIEPPRIDCPANFTEYTDCRKENSTISLPNVNSASDNSGEYTIRVDVQGKEYQVGDTVTLALEGSPHLLRYIATDDSSNRRACDSFVNVTSVNDGSSCLTTGSPPNCICSSNQEGSCTCSAGYCGHDCSQNDVGTLCTGPKEPYPNCEGVNKCSPGFTGPTCKEPSSEINCPEVANQCLKWGVNSVSIQWTQVKAVDSSGNPISPADITCQDVKGATSVELTGGEFKIGEHEVVCSSDTGGVVVPVCLISFTVSSNPTFKVPEIGDQCTDLGKSTSNVTWDIVPAADEEDVTIICTGSEGSTDVGPTGGVFKVGAHTVTCTATTSGGCIKSKIFGFSVLEGNIIPFGVEMGDSLLSDAFQENQQTSKDLISPTIFPPNFFPFCDELYESLYFTDNGVIVLSNDKSLEKWAFPNIPGLKFPNGPPMIAPFWADVQAETFSPESNVFWQVYDQYDPNTNQYMLDTIKDIVSKVVDIRNNTNAVYWALAITWSNVQPVSSSYASGTNTFQVLLLTDSIHSYVVFNYGPCNMNWDTAFLPNKNVILGYTCGMSKESVYLDVPKNSLFRPGSFVGNSGQKGRWVFQLDNHLDDFVNPRLSCRNWYSRQAPYPIFDVYYPSFANTCPCSLIMAWFDWRFLLTWRQSYIPPGEVSEYFQDQSVLCFVRLFQLSGTPGTQCCYKRWTGDLLYDVRSPKVASVFERFPYSDLFYTADAFQEWYEEEVLSRYYCCEKSTLCHLYIEWRPLVTCSRYFPTFWGWFWGDPHVRTLDGVDYTFNGLGEYTLVLIEDENRKEKLFELQGRTKRVYNPEMDELTNATSYSGFAAEDVASDGRVEIKLNEQATNLITTVNGEVVEPTAAGLVIGGLTVRKVEDPPKVEAIFASDIQFSVGVNNSFVDVTVQLSQDFEGKTKGLLGVWDGNKTNDILRRDGTYQSPSGSNGTMLENDYFEFGETWRVSVNDSLFYYLSPEESWEKINDLSFRPKFLDELLAGVNEEERQQIKEVCGDNKECIYDALTLNNTDIGIATLQLNEKNSEDLKSATNYPPELKQFESIEVTIGQNFTQQIDATDPDGDEVAIYLLEAVEGASIKDGLFSWTPADKSKVRIGFIASDGKANSSLEPIVNLCDCKNDGTCLLNQYAEGTNLVQDRFGVLLCQCTSGWTGEFCEVNYNACAVSPCFSEVTCTDKKPPSLNSTCGPCPDGLEGDGKTCTDIDECERYKDDPARGCEQICENTLRSFNCSCNSGYFLNEDKKTCRALSATDCLNEGEFDESSHECICPLTHYGPTCADENPCLSDNTLCSEEGQHCLPESNTVGFACYCRGFDGYVEITLDGSCEAYASVGVMLTAKMEFVIAYKNPTSTAFNKTATMFERAIQERLQEMPSTNNLVKIQVTRMDEGSLIITAVVSYGTIPSLDEVKKVLSSSDSLTDGNTTIPIDPDSVRVQKLSSECLLECLNGGTCERPDYSPIDSCRCSPGYAGDRCETGVEPVPDGLPTVALALIVVGCILFVLVIIPGVIYIVMRKNFRKKVDKVVDGEESRVQEDIRELSLHGELFNDGYEATEFSEEGIRMEYLRRGMPATELKRTKNQNSYIPSFHRNDME